MAIVAFHSLSYDMKMKAIFFRFGQSSIKLLVFSNVQFIFMYHVYEFQRCDSFNGNLTKIDHYVSKFYTHSRKFLCTWIISFMYNRIENPYKHWKIYFIVFNINNFIRGFGLVFEQFPFDFNRRSRIVMHFGSFGQTAFPFDWNFRFTCKEVLRIRW